MLTKLAPTPSSALLKLDYEKVDINALPKHVEQIINASLNCYLTFSSTSPTAKEKIRVAIAAMEHLTRFKPEHPKYAVNVFSQLVKSACTLQRIKDRCSVKEDIRIGLDACIFHLGRYIGAVGQFIQENADTVEVHGDEEEE